MTFAMELHWWKTGRDTDLFYVWVRLGFISLAFSKVLVSETLQNIRTKLKEDDEIIGEVVCIPHHGSVH